MQGSFPGDWTIGKQGDPFIELMTVLLFDRTPPTSSWFPINLTRPVLVGEQTFPPPGAVSLGPTAPSVPPPPSRPPWVPSVSRKLAEGKGVGMGRRRTVCREGPYNSSDRTSVSGEFFRL